MVKEPLTWCAIGLMIGIMVLTLIIEDSSPYEWIPSCTTSGGGHWGPREYYDGAPDGWFYVCCGWQKEGESEVFFPLCPSSGTRLHGTWKTTVFLDNFQGEVRVENNVIVEKS